MRFAGYCSLAGLAVFAATSALAHELTNGRVTVDLGENTSTTDYVNSISWIRSDGSSTGNLAMSGGPVDCGDSQEFFGQSYGDTDSGQFLMVYAGTPGKWTSNNATSGTSKTSGKKTCFPVSGKTTTGYSLSASAKKTNMLTVERVFTFSADAASHNENLRAYAARMNLSTYTTVIYPDSTGALKSNPIGNCPFAGANGCEVTDWNGQWFADDDGAGNGLMVIRDPGSKAPALLAMDYDSYSNSNVTSIVLVKPAAGWSGKVSETEHLCFYDAKTWTAKDRTKGKLPTGCQVK